MRGWQGIVLMSCIVPTVLALWLLASQRKPLADPAAEPILQSVATGDTLRVTRYLDDGGNPNVQDSYGWTPLMWAAIEDRREIARKLLDAGGWPDQVTTGGNVKCLVPGSPSETRRKLDELRGLFSRETTALDFAVYLRHREMAELLLTRGATVKRTDTRHEGALAIARRAGDLRMVQLIKRHQ